MRRIAAFLLATLLTGPVLAQSGKEKDLFPQGPYGEALRDQIARPLDGIDFAALRTIYASDPDYDGRSQLYEAVALALSSSPDGRPLAAWTEEAVLRAIFADFPLLETHYAAVRHFDAAGTEDAASIADSHRYIYGAILDAILATRQPGSRGPVYVVLSVREEYSVLSALDLTSRRQSLVSADSGLQDCHDTAEGPVCFDISAFFGRY